MTDSLANQKTRLSAERLEERDVPAGFLVDAPESGEPSIVRVLDGTTGTIKVQFDAFPGYAGGLYADASNDRNGDGLPDRVVVGTRLGNTPHAKVFDGSGNLLQSFFAYAPGFLGGVDVALGDVNNDRVEDVITGAAGGTSPHVKAFDGRNLNLLQSFYAYDGAFVGGVRVSGGDLDGDGQDDIITGAGPGAGSHVKVFRGNDLALLSSRIVFELAYAGGVNVFVNDVSGNGRDDLVVERSSGIVRYRAFDDNGVDGPFHDLFDDVYDDNGGHRGGSGGIVGQKIEGTVVAVNAAARQVAIRTGGGTVTVAAAPGAKIERNDIDTTLAAFRVGDRGEAIIGTNGLALKIEAYGL